MPISKLLIANRGEIACRVIRTAHKMGIKVVAVYSDADANALHVEMADEAVRIGPAPAAKSYLQGDVIIAAAKTAGAQAIHPGYGFLSENPDFVEAVENAGLIFVGPSAKAIRAMGLKDGAKRLMQDAGVPIVPGYHGANQDADFLAGEAQKIGYPVLIKARAGGGGKGMRRVDAETGFADALASARREAKSAFGDDNVLIEKYVTAPRHIEVQVFGDSYGNVVHLFERDCSLQRRHQKVIEEAPAPGMPEAVRAAMTGAAVKAATAIAYSGAGTIEFIVDGSGALRPDGFWFMEMNTRLQVEHPITELVTGQDLVEWQLRVAAGEKLPLSQGQIVLRGHAFEARLYAEDPANDFLPQTGTLHHLGLSDLARNDTGVRAGDSVPPYYDPMISKIIVHGQTREAALLAFQAALNQTHVAGTVTNARFLANLAAHLGFARGEIDTDLIVRDLDQLVEWDMPGEEAVFIAALVALNIDLAAPFAGWRLWGDAAHRVCLNCGGETFERRLILHGNGSASLQSANGSTLFQNVHRTSDQITLRFGENLRRVSASVASFRTVGGLTVSVQVEGATYAFVAADPLAASSEHSDVKDDIVAPTTGTVTAVMVSVGDTIARGQKLIVIEAMKMETSLSAQRDGVVAAILCSPNAPVESGVILLRLEPQE